MDQVLIVEDEPHVARHLQMQLALAAPHLQVAFIAESVAAATKWLKLNKPDLILMDIRLGDELSFSIFDQVQVEAPVIFTTAYDEYALKAFGQHSIAYLLKPVHHQDLKKALDKWLTLQKLALEQVHNLVNSIKAYKPTYRDRFMVTEAGKIKSLTASNISLFLSEGRYTRITDFDGHFYLIDDTMEKLETSLDPAQFFRINRQAIVNFKAITKMTPWSKSRIKVDVWPDAPAELVVSTERTAAFKEWLNK